MDRRQLLALAFVVAALTTGCTHKEQSSTTTTGNETSSTSEATTGAPEANASATVESAVTIPPNTPVTFNFTDVAVTTGAAPVLRLGFGVKNGFKDPLICNESEFSLKLSDGTVLQTDSGAENSCTPDTVDPGTTGTGNMFFDLPSGYSGPVTLIMRSSDTNDIIGAGTTQVH